MERPDGLAVIFTAIGSTVLFIIAIVVLALKIKTYLDAKFSELKSLMFSNFRLRDLAIRRIELWAVRHDVEFQPGVEPLEFGGDKNGSQGH